MHIVIISYDWPPRNAISVHRSYSWAKHWVEQGFKITVLTAAKQTFDEPLDLFLPKLPVSIIEVSYSKVFWAFDLILRFSWIRSVAKSLIKLMSKKLNINIDPRTSWRRAAKPHVLKLSKETDYVISTYGPASAHLIALDMKKTNPKIKWIADYRDPWSQNYIVEISKKRRQSMREEEISSVGQYADKITAVSQHMVSQLSYFLKKPVLKIPNGFDIGENEVKRIISRSKKVIKQPFRIVYTGIIYRGVQDPKPLLDAISHLSKSNQINSSDVTVDFYGDKLEVVNEHTKQPEFKSFIRLMGHVKREIALDAQRDAGALLLLASSHPKMRGALSGKIFEYIVAGRPILCVGSRSEYEIGQLLHQTWTGVVIGPNDLKKLPKILLELIQNPTNVKWYKPNIVEILKYSRHKQALQLLSEITKT
jgi:hypothetical protein